MKKLFIALVALMPLSVVAQNTWERPQQQTQTETKTKRKALIEKKEKTLDPKYGVGMVPEVDGKVVFTFERDIPGMSADEIYQRLYDAMDALAKSEEQHESQLSQIAVVNKAEHTIAARYKEWLVFQNTFLSLDRTVFNYTLIARATDGHATVTLERIGYQYEMDRTDNSSGGLDTKAEEWITDEVAINKKKNGFTRQSGKFRKQTSARKDEGFTILADALGVY